MLLSPSLPHVERRSGLDNGNVLYCIPHWNTTVPAARTTLISNHIRFTAYPGALCQSADPPDRRSGPPIRSLEVRTALRQPQLQRGVEKSHLEVDLQVMRVSANHDTTVSAFSGARRTVRLSIWHGVTSSRPPPVLPACLMLCSRQQGMNCACVSPCCQVSDLCYISSGRSCAVAIVVPHPAHTFSFAFPLYS